MTLRLPDLYQVTKIHYDPEYGRIRLWSGHSPEHRTLVNLKHPMAIHGLPLILEIMSAITGRVFNESPDGHFYRDDTPEGRRLKQETLSAPQHQNT